ncbi:MAG: TM2 domain-containing protein [Planctomycetota bacterium]|jgi:TM2 domain-containing membrane protein YozV
MKSNVPAYLLWFFLGVFGGHRFYLRRPGTAILMFFTMFIYVGFIWWIIDAFLIPSMVRDCNSSTVAVAGVNQQQNQTNQQNVTVVVQAPSAPQPEGGAETT